MVRKVRLQLRALRRNADSLIICLNKQVVPRTGKCLFQLDNRIDGGILISRFNVLDESATKVSSFSQAFLGQLRSSTKAANILAKGNMRRSLHRAYHAVARKVESEL